MINTKKNNQFIIYQDGKKIDGKVIKKCSDKLFLIQIFNKDISSTEEKIGRLVNSWIEI